MMRTWGLLALMAVLAAAPVAWAQNRREKAVRDDKQALADNKDWLYDDLEQGRRTARAENKPLLVLIRCIP